MKKEYNKEYEYKGYKFNIFIQFNPKTIGKFNGKSWHKLIVTDIKDSNYYYSSEIKDTGLTYSLTKALYNICKYVNDKENVMITFNELLLANLGFK